MVEEEWNREEIDASWWWWWLAGSRQQRQSGAARLERRDATTAITHTHVRPRTALQLLSKLSSRMESPPVPISLYTINLILQYISPPSQLAYPIPSNLLSHSLLQRHALLELSPADSSSYLSWPSSGRDCAIQHLESLQMPLDELASDFLAGYTTDSEHAYAHVHVKPTGDDGLRLVFEWDGQDSWKYHDSNVMPFPPGTHPSLDDAISAAVTASSPELSRIKQEKSENDDGESNDNDYWNSYGTEDGRGMQLQSSMSKGETDASEDAYWARYTSVQGIIPMAPPRSKHSF